VIASKVDCLPRDLYIKCGKGGVVIGVAAGDIAFALDLTREVASHAETQLFDLFGGVALHGTGE
jgi:hypothetical protein